MEIARGFLGIGIVTVFIVCVVLLVKRSRKTFYNMFNVQIVTAFLSAVCISGGIGMLISYVTSDSFRESEAKTNFILIYACVGIMIFGVILFGVNIYFGYKGLGSVVYSVINYLVQAAIGFCCAVTLGFGLIFVVMTAKKVTNSYGVMVYDRDDLIN